MAQERSGENCASKQQHSVTILGFLKVTKNVDFSLLINIKKLLFVTLCDMTAGNGATFLHTIEWTGVEVEIVI